MKFYRSIFIVAYLLWITAPLHAGWLTALINPNVNPIPQPRGGGGQKSEVNKISPAVSEFDLKSRLGLGILTLAQQQRLHKEQNRINRLYTAAMRDGAVDEWEQLLLDRAVEHARKVVSVE